MPDRWGRLTGDDFMSWANSINSIKNSYREHQKWKDYQEDRQEQQQFKDDVNYNAGLYEDDSLQYGDGTPYATRDDAVKSALRGSPQAKIEGTRYHLMRKKQKDQMAYDQVYKKIVEWHQANPKASLDDMPKDLYLGVQGHKARAAYLSDYAKQDEIQRGIRQAREKEIWEKEIPLFFARKAHASELLSSGDFDGAAKIIEDMSQKLSNPHSLKYDPKTKMFQKLYMASETGRPEIIEEISPQEVFKEVMDIRADTLRNFLLLNREAVRQHNEEKAKNPQIWKNRKGQTFLVTAFKNPGNANRVDYNIYDEANNHQVVHLRDDLYKMGLRPENLQREKLLLENKKSNAALIGKLQDNQLFPYREQQAQAALKGQQLQNETTGLKLKQLQNPQPKPLTIKEQEAAYERNTRAFAIQAKDLGVEIDQATGDVVGTVPAEALPKLLEMAEYYGVQIADGQGQVIDMNGWWPGGKQKFVQIQALPFGTKLYQEPNITSENRHPGERSSLADFDKRSRTPVPGSPKATEEQIQPVGKIQGKIIGQSPDGQFMILSEDNRGGVWIPVSPEEQQVIKQELAISDRARSLGIGQLHTHSGLLGMPAKEWWPNLSKMIVSGVRGQ